MTLEEEITALTLKWYKYVNLDHHKDRDCHWYIEKVWSYGNDPYYIAHHSGYLIDNWTSPKVETEELAMTILRDKLKRELDDAVIWLKDRIDMEEELDDWFGVPIEKVKEFIDKF